MSDRPGGFLLGEVEVGLISREIPTEVLDRHSLHGGHIWQWYFKAHANQRRAIRMEVRLSSPAVAEVQTGERFACILYRNGDLSLGIGFNDDLEEEYYLRALPWWKPRSSIALLDKVDERGIEWTVPRLKEGEALYRHFIIAYGRDIPDLLNVVDKGVREVDHLWQWTQPK